MATEHDALLAAFTSIVQDLTNLGDPLGALRGVLRKACAALQTDIGLVAVRDSSRGLHRVVAVHGTRDHALIGQECPIGVDLLGTVAANGRPSWDSDLRSAGIDSAELTTALVESGVIAALCVPVIARGRTIGTLLIGSTSTRAWVDNDSHQLDRFSLLTALVVRHFFNDRGEAVTEAPGSWHRFMNARRWSAMHGEPVQVFWSGLERRLGCTVTYLTADGSIAGHRLPSEAVADAWKLSAGYDRAVLTGETCTVEFNENIAWLHRVDDHDALHGVMSVWKPRGGTPISHYQLADCAFITSLHFTIDRLQTVASQRWELLLLEQLLQGEGDLELSDERLLQYGLRRGQVCTVVRIDADQTVQQKAYRLVRHEFRYQRPLLSIHNTHLCLVLPGPLNDNRLQNLSEALTNGGIDAFIAAEEAPAGPSMLKEAHEIVRVLNTSQRVLGRYSGVATTAVFGIAGLLYAAASAPLLDRIVRSRLGAVLDYDAERGTDLEHTAWAFLAAGRHSAQTAEKLHIHQNTLRQRIERIDALIGPEWREAPNSYEMFLALEARRLTTG